MNVPMPMATKTEAEVARRMVVWGRTPVYCTIGWIPVRELVATQDEVLASRVEYLEGVTCPGPIEVALIGERYFIVEGHHRATAAIRRKHSSILASVRSTVPQSGEGA